VVFRNRLDAESKIALFRIAQEALTNIERHAGATEVSIKLFGHKKGATLQITDNGRGIGDNAPATAQGGLGLRNMQERVEQLDGTLHMTSTKDGTVIKAQIPLTHLLPPEETQG
ncbi:MAG TPA: histidine kinase, partial [Rhodobacteraceae bacterium]|nr:histidine kinase [Paracoccaceae bacterium]